MRHEISVLPIVSRSAEGFGQFRFGYGIRQAFFTVPCHSTDLEVAQVSAIFLFRLARELGREELYRRHRRRERVDVVLREVSTAQQSATNRQRLEQDTHTLRRPFWLTCPDSGLSSPVSSLMLLHRL